MSLAGQISLLATRVGQECKSIRSVMLQALSIGTVTTGAAGSNASATITGTAPSQTLNLTIPTGATGATPVITTTSTTSLILPASGSKAFTTQAGAAWAVGMYVRVTSNSNGSAWTSGNITAYSGTSLTVNLTDNGSVSGTFTDWNIVLSGNRGLTGGTGTNSVTTSTSATSLTIATGSITFTTATAMTIPVGDTLRVWNTGTPANYMVGSVTAITGTSVTVSVTEIGGTGTFTAWTIAQGAYQGAAGSGGTSGANYSLTTEYTNTDPTAPATGLTVFTKSRGRDNLTILNPQGEDSTVQTSLAFNRVCRWTAINNNAVPVGDGMGVVANTGAAAVASATTNFFSSLARVAYPVASTTTAASLAGFRGAQAQWFLSSTANMGGFYMVCRVGIATSAAGSRGFIGMSTTTSSLAAGSDPSTLLNQVGFGIDAASTNWYFIASGGTAGTKVDLGANFPCKTSGTDFFEFSLYAPSAGGSKILWSARRLNDDAYASGSNTTTLPALNTLMVPQVFYTNGTSAANAVLHFQSLYIETDN